MPQFRNVIDLKTDPEKATTSMALRLLATSPITSSSPGCKQRIHTLVEFYC